MNLQNANLAELNAQEIRETEGGNQWGGVLYDLYYGGGGAEILWKCAKARADAMQNSGDIDASQYTGGTPC
ncbi:MAG: hypothetical protein LAT51_06350 [Flavobacteriaceae bacterium]|nr:hypothetical protein [Flavobacteriaceae bacterium]